MPQIEKRYLLAKSDFHATQMINRIYAGRFLEYEKVLHTKRQYAVCKLQKYPLGQQELFEIYEVPFDKELIRHG